MGLLNSFIAILVIQILFLKVMNIWCASEIPFEELEGGDSKEHLNNMCNKVSRFEHKVPLVKLVPYLETYRRYRLPLYMGGDSEEQSSWSFPIMSRTNYRKKRMCCEGYVLSGASCVPRCPQSCEKGTCKEPDVCTCNEGYHMSSNGTCLPKCSNGCVNGTCIEPELCSCHKGYWLDSDGFTCLSVCQQQCGYHEYCSEPNVCTCRSGYMRTGIDPYPSMCKPICDEPCVLGKCTAPNTCTCDDGHRAVNASVCEPILPICEHDCTTSEFNSHCLPYVPERCSCSIGFERRKVDFKDICRPICGLGFVNDETTHICKPHCEPRCGPTTECTSPNKCTCSKGYQHAPDRFEIYGVGRYFKWPIDCEPICEFDCVNGWCSGPNECTCARGYYPSWLEFHQPIDNSTTHVCERFRKPRCNALSCGKNGTCHAIGICVCNEGYARDTDGDCVPFCVQKCTNGTCTAPNRCACHDGFASLNDSFCEPVCERGCQNGDCVGPNRCVCHDNFVPNDDHHSRPECIPVCTRNCSGHGECVTGRSPDEYTCECHFGWTGGDCDKPTMCAVTVAYDHDSANRITIRNATNSTIVRAYENAPDCYQCDNSFDNETLCYVMQSDEGNTTTITCLLSTDLPCYTSPSYTASINVAKTVWPFVILSIIISLTGLTVTAYLIHRKRQKKKMAMANIPPNIFVRESFATELLLADI